MQVFQADGKVNPEWIVQMKENDPAAGRIRAFYLPGKNIRSDVQCWNHNCLLPRTGVIQITSIGRYRFSPIVFCYYCNRTYHVLCEDLDLDGIKRLRAPYECRECFANPFNDHRTDFFKQSDYAMTIQARRKLFIQKFDDNEDYETDAEFDDNDKDCFDLNEDGEYSICEKPLIDDAWKFFNATAEEDAANLRAVREENAKLKIQVDNDKRHHQVQIESLMTSFKRLQDQLNNLQKVPPKERLSDFYDTRRKTSTPYDHIGLGRQSLPNFNEQTPKTTRGFSNNPSNQNAAGSSAQQQQTSNSQCSSDDANLLGVMNRFAMSQERVEKEQQLSNLRKAMPKITEFNGEAMKWLEFEQDVERYRSACKYDDETIKLHVRGALKGEAFAAVRDVFDMLKLEEIMDILRETFGDPMILVRRKAKDIRDVAVPSVLYREDAVKLKILLQSYFAACKYAKTGNLNSNELGEKIYNQLGAEDKARCKELFMRLYPGQQIVICLNVIYEYMSSRMLVLDEKPGKKDKPEVKKDDRKSNKPYQVNAISASSGQNSSGSKNEAWKYEIRDKTIAPYCGYDLEKVFQIAKKCEICNRNNHYTPECKQYQSLDLSQRSNVVTDRKLCRNCLITTGHRASECDLKLGCGTTVNRTDKCAQKHHQSLHGVSFNANGRRSSTRGGRRSGTNTNSRNAMQLLNNLQNQSSSSTQVTQTAQTTVQSNEQNTKNNVSQTPKPIMQSATHFHTQIPREYNMQNHNISLEDSPHTVKMFKHKFIGPKGFTIAFSIGDSAAEGTFVRDDLRRALGIEGVPQEVVLGWTDGTIKSIMAIKFDLKVQGILPHSQELTLEGCFAIQEFTPPPRSLNMALMKKKFPYLQDVDFDGYENEEPVMLIGSPHAFAIEGIKGLITGGSGCPVALESLLGITVYGGSHVETSLSQMSTALDNEKTEESAAITNEQLHDLLNEFNSLQSLGIRANNSFATESEKNAIAILQEQMKVLDNGAIEVPLVWNRQDGEIPQLPNNYSMVYKRQIAHETKLKKNPEQLKIFNDSVQEWIQLKYIRYANEQDLNSPWDNVWYLPMSLIFNYNKIPPKPRIVYDASAKFEGVSLNNFLLKGPDLLINQLKPLLRMRLFRIAFSADVQQMYHRIRINQRDSQCQRLLWRENDQQPFKTLILGVMAFGPSCSPFTSQYVKNWNADRFANQYPNAANALKELTFMDDVLAGEPSVEKAVETAKQCIEICKSIDWNLVSFQSNSVEFLRQLPGNHVKQDLFPILSSDMESYTTKVLGCNWDTVQDCYIFNFDKNIFIKLVKDFEHNPTKRELASTIARIYDVFGFLAHFVIRGRIILQRCWKQKLAWDEKVPDDLVKPWKEWVNDIENVAKLKIPRLYADVNSLAETDKIQLHIFSDAGIEAFGAVAYLVISKNKSTTSSIVMGRAKVTPIKLSTKTEILKMPQLELLAALLAARIGNTISNIYNDLEMERFFWSDSEVVLRWILNPDHNLVKYARAPIEEILELSKRHEWQYVPTSLNVADECTKFRNIDFGDSNSRWFIGPKFITQSKDNWPQLPEKLCIDYVYMANNIYLKKLNYATHILPPITCEFTSDSQLDKFSSSIKADWGKLTRQTARALKIFLDCFIPTVKAKQLNNRRFLKELKHLHNGFRQLSAADIERAEHFIFRRMQRESFGDDYKNLAAGKTIKNKLFQELNVFMDEQGLIRINSRVNLNSLSYPQQFVPLLPRKNGLIPILLLHYHYKYKHVTIESQIAEIRTKCWIPQIRVAMRKMSKCCNICIFRKAMPYGPAMAQLPTYRVDPDLQPFEVTGVDCLGPIVVKMYGRYKKIWIMIFVCTLTRFIDLHILESLESLRVLEAIVCFWGSHGPVRKFISDNGTNFKGASRLLKEDYANANKALRESSKTISSKLSESYSVDWEFIPAHSPWFGGFYERLIKEVKRSIQDTLSERKIDRIQLNIAIKEAAHRINLRPLTHNAIAAEDADVLTPHHLAKHRPGWPLLPGMHKGKFGEVTDRSIYRRGRAIADQILAKFVSLYLPVLTKRTKWCKDTAPLKKNDLVLLIEPNKTRKQWQRGIVLKIYSSRDRKGRVADVKLSDGVIRKARTVRNLARIEISPMPTEL